MAITDYKVADADKVTLDDATGESPKLKLISSLSNRPAEDGYTATAIKALFDAIPVTYIGLTKLNGLITLFNSLIDYLNEYSGDLSIAADGIEATTITTALEELLGILNTIKGEGWTNESIKTNATAIAAIIAKYGAANGLATLNADGKIPADQMNPEAVVEGTIETALTARAYDPTFTDNNSIKEKFDTKQDNNLYFTNIEIAISGFEEDATYSDYPYRASVALTDVTASMYAEVVFSLEQSASGLFAPICETYSGGVYLYSTETNSEVVTIPTIKVEV